jgi:23S rRNA maturation-related 3'-5' exoribonuclease YhaM
MRKLILILMLLTPVWAFTQTHTFTENEVVGMDSLFQVYEQNDSIRTIEINLLNTQLTNYQKLNEQDSLHIMYLEENIVLLNQRIDLYIDLTKELEPKWFKKPVFQFILGAATIVTSSWVVSNIK